MSSATTAWKMPPSNAAPMTPSAAPVLPFPNEARLAPGTKVLMVGWGAGMTRAIESQAAAVLGCTSVSAEDAEGAAAALERESPALVLLDGSAAYQKGAETFRLLKEARPEVPVVLVADPSTPAEIVEECWRWGLDDLLLRPLRAADLKARLLALQEARGAEARADRYARRVLLLDGEDPVYSARLGELLLLNGYRLLRLAPGQAAEAARAHREAAAELVVAVGDRPAATLRALGSEEPALGQTAALVAAAEPAPGELPAAVKGWFDRRAAGPEAVLARVNAHFEVGSRTLQAEQRVPFYCPVEFREWGNAKASWSSAYSFNVSAGGIFLRTLVPARPRAAVELRIHLTTTREELPATGVVAWANRPTGRGPFAGTVGMGLQFLGMPVSKRLAQLIEICRGTAAL